MTFSYIGRNIVQKDNQGRDSSRPIQRKRRKSGNGGRNIVPVLIKPDKTVRLCVDFRPLNKITQNDPYPTGNLHEVLDNLGFSVIDLAQGYLQVPLAKEDRPETAFRSPTGFWKWARRKSGNFFSVDAEGSRTHSITSVGIVHG